MRMNTGLVAVLVCTLWAGIAQADLVGLRRFGASTEGIAAQTLASSRSLAIASDQLTGYDTLVLWVTVTDANNSETGVSVSCTGQMAGAGNAYRIPACQWDATNLRYNCEAGPLFWNPSDETSPKRQIFRYRTLGAPNATCTFSFTGGAAADAIDVTAFAAATGS